MRELQVVGIPNDKEYGFSLEAVEVQQVIHAETFGSNSHQEISHFDVYAVSIAERYAKLCIRIGRFERHASLGHSMVRTFGIQGSSLETSLVTTIKTHKGYGFIEHRNIHAAACPKLRGLSFWLTQVLDGHIRRYPHLLLSTEDFVQRLAAVRVEVDDRLVRIDLSHFHVGGLGVVVRWSVSSGALRAEACSGEGCVGFPHLRAVHKVQVLAWQNVACRKGFWHGPYPLLCRG
jgi:hypothetical protein